MHELTSVRDQHPELGVFDSWHEVIDHLWDLGSPVDEKSGILRALLYSVQHEGSSAVQTTLLLAFWPGLSAIAHRRIRWNDQEDSLWPVLQQSFLETIRSLDVSPPAVNLAGAIMRATAETLRQECRREVAYESRRLDLVEMVDPVQSNDEARIRLAIAKRRVSRAYHSRRLSAADLRLLREIDIEGNTLEEAAQARGISYDTVKKRRQRALGRLEAPPRKKRTDPAESLSPNDGPNGLSG